MTWAGSEVGANNVFKSAGKLHCNTSAKARSHLTGSEAGGGLYRVGKLPPSAPVSGPSSEPGGFFSLRLRPDSRRSPKLRLETSAFGAQGRRSRPRGFPSVRLSVLQGEPLEGTARTRGIFSLGCQEERLISSVPALCALLPPRLKRNIIWLATKSSSRQRALQIPHVKTSHNFRQGKEDWCFQARGPIIAVIFCSLDLCLPVIFSWLQMSFYGFRYGFTGVSERPSKYWQLVFEWMALLSFY